MDNKDSDQTDFSLRWTYISEGTFSHFEAQIVRLLSLTWARPDCLCVQKKKKYDSTSMNANSYGYPIYPKYSGLCISVLRVASGPRVKLARRKSVFNPPPAPTPTRWFILMTVLRR